MAVGSVEVLTLQKKQPPSSNQHCAPEFPAPCATWLPTRCRWAGCWSVLDLFDMRTWNDCATSTTKTSAYLDLRESQLLQELFVPLIGWSRAIGAGRWLLGSHSRSMLRMDPGTAEPYS